MLVGVTVGVSVLVGVTVGVSVLVGVTVGVSVLVTVLVRVTVGVRVLVGVVVGVRVAVLVIVGVLVVVGLAVLVNVLVGVFVCVGVIVGVGKPYKHQLDDPILPGAMALVIPFPYAISLQKLLDDKETLLHESPSALIEAIFEPELRDINRLLAYMIWSC